MSARIIDGRAIAAEVRADVARDVEAFRSEHGRAPGLATVLVGDDPASRVYVSGKHRACEEAGIRSIGHELGSDTTADSLLGLLAELNADPDVDGVLVQLPLPEQLGAEQIVEAVDPAKDVDGLTSRSAGLLALGRPGLVPCTPAGVMELLAREQVELSGARAVVVGRSVLVGRPLAQLLLAEHATVTIAHSRTRDLDAVCRTAEVLVAAVGRPRMIGAEGVAPGAVVIDVGITRTADGLVGDVDLEAVAGKASAITPVPGGVGPMTIAMLLRNTLVAAHAREAATEPAAGGARRT